MLVLIKRPLLYLAGPSQLIALSFVLLAALVMLLVSGADVPDERYEIG